jgi:hypothetical protein
MTGFNVTDAERPVLKVLLMRAEWHRGDNPMLLTRHPHSFVIVDILAVERYLELEYRVVALDPESEMAWRIWRDKHPEAA